MADRLPTTEGDEEKMNCHSHIRPSTMETAGEELVPHVVTTGDIEVPNNNDSGQQLVPHVAINVPSSVEVSSNSGLQDGNNDGDWKHATFFGLADCATAIIALMNKPPSSSESVYLVAELVVFTAGILEMLGALWVSSDSRKRRTAEKTILYTSFVTFLLGLVLDFYAYTAKK